jgi:hypothetical protein
VVVTVAGAGQLLHLVWHRCGTGVVAAMVIAVRTAVVIDEVECVEVQR